MPDPVLLDTSAFITLTDSEPGLDRVQELVRQAVAGEVQLFGCFATLTEVQYIKTQDDGPDRAAELMRLIKELPVAWIHTDESLCARAAEIKAAHKVSFADAFVVSAALRVNAVLVHKDPEFTPLSNIVKQEMLPPKGLTATS